MIRVVSLLGITVALTACGSAAHARTVATAPDSPICAFYGTTVAVGLLAQHPHDAGVTIARLRPRWAKVLQVAEQGGRVRWTGPSASETGAAYSRFLADLRSAGAAIDRADLPGFQAALRAANTHLVAVDVLAKRSHRTCTIVSPDGSTMTFGS